MISIKQLLDRPERARLAAESRATNVELRQLLHDSLEARRRWERETLSSEFDTKVRKLVHLLEEQPQAQDVTDIAIAAFRLFEEHTCHANGYFREQGTQMQSMLAMLTATVAEISANSDESVARLQAVEQQIERASSLDDIRTLKLRLETCLTMVKQAATQQRNAAQATVAQLHENIRRGSSKIAAAPAVAGDTADTEPAISEYLISFKLQRAEQIRARFGEAAIEQLLTSVEAALKIAEQPQDRLVRWKRDSLLMLVSSPEAAQDVRQRIAAVATRIGQQYVELGQSSALFAVRLDWVVFPLAQYATTEAAYGEVDSFLDGKVDPRL